MTDIAGFHNSKMINMFIRDVAIRKLSPIPTPTQSIFDSIIDYRIIKCINMHALHADTYRYRYRYLTTLLMFIHAYTCICIYIYIYIILLLYKMNYLFII